MERNLCSWMIVGIDICRFNTHSCAKAFYAIIMWIQNDRKHIMQFAPENYWTGDRESLDSGLPSKYNIDAILSSNKPGGALSTLNFIKR